MIASKVVLLVLSIASVFAFNDLSEVVISLEHGSSDLNERIAEAGPRSVGQRISTTCSFAFATDYDCQRDGGDCTYFCGGTGVYQYGCYDSCLTGSKCTGGVCSGRNQGGSCGGQSDCRIGRELGAIPLTCSGTCTAATDDLFVAGDYCIDSSECVGALNCVGGRCDGFDEGDGCASSDECNPGLFCSGGTCADQGQPGDGCDESATNPCRGFAACLDGECVAVGGAGQGDSCDAAIRCSGSLVCSGGECVQSDSGDSCDVNADCDTGLCLCDISASTSYCATGEDICPAKASLASIQTCGLSSGCRFPHNSFIYTSDISRSLPQFSCLGVNCGDDYYGAVAECINALADLLYPFTFGSGGNCGDLVEVPASRALCGVPALYSNFVVQS